MEPANDRPRSVDDLIALISTSVATIVLAFTLILYAHYFHLHTCNNHLYIIVSFGSAFLASQNIFWNIFSFPSDEHRFTTTHCLWSGYLHEMFSITMLMSVFASWVVHAAEIHRRRSLTIQSVLGVVVTAFMCLAVGICGASIAIGVGSLHHYHQAWCHGGETWYVALFQLAPIGLTLVPMFMATVYPLRSGNVNSEQKTLIRRRMVCHILWVCLEVYSTIGTELRHSSFGKAEQAALEPLSGVVLAVGFLFSERMLTFRALGLPPGADPPHGFTNVMHYLPDKLYYEDTESLMRDTTLHHNIKC